MTRDTRIELKDYATEYTIGDFILKWKGKGWAILEKDFQSSCYDYNDNDFTIEPMPSNRTDEFFKACRFGLKESLIIINYLQITNNGKEEDS